MRTTAVSLMLHSRRRPAKLFTDFNTPQFASAMSMVVFVVLIIFTTMPTPHHGMYPDLPKVDHPISMRAADREDTMRIFVPRDGKVHFGSERRDGARLSLSSMPRTPRESGGLPLWWISDLLQPCICSGLRLLSRPVLNPDWRPHKSEGVTDLILQKSLISEV